MSINISAEQAETFKNYLMRRAELTAEETGYDPAFILDGYIETLEDADGLEWGRRKKSMTCYGKTSGTMPENARQPSAGYTG